jgi:hypothetical protein
MVEPVLCTKCKGLQFPEFFFKDKRKKNGLSSICKSCQNKANNIYLNSEKGKRALQRHFSSTKRRYQQFLLQAKTRRIIVEISIKEYEELISKPCYYCEGKMKAETKFGSGIDRLNSKIGYIENNLVACCKVCNFIKGDYLTPEETKVAVNAVLEYRKNNGTV